MDINEEGHEYYEVYKFGWWPEIVGVFAVGGVLWYLITFARGTL